eukprot:349177-Prymnesium_polylepis.2
MKACEMCAQLKVMVGSTISLIGAVLVRRTGSTRHGSGCLWCHILDTDAFGCHVVNGYEL